MTQGVRPRGAGRAQLHETALRLFARDGVEGTSLQAIADDMGVTKAAVYHHYRSKDELVLGVLAPLFTELDAIVDRAAAHRSRSARLDEFLTGVVGLIVDSHSRFAVLVRDPYVGRLMETHHDLAGWWMRVTDKIIGAGADPIMPTALIVFLSGMTAPLTKPPVPGLDAGTQRALLIECGRRILQIRRRTA
ncbi:TetR/AcrR family transcriptional regulator [Actinoplanes sp. KI2]|uniref:TetR/AcrR family transcriptional regulator n=1 Tax=Actinoplanes sp. KI2 TaxID=2983315 RepID=UPI0021D5D16E|nr:TetR/AcrR family transcriptional regulator [Actinoplanes sp. KI2]MCU7726189.1 TetR/AcrR family transcriptional regulator [Actinoplanes sp. KI2]